MDYPWGISGPAFLAMYIAGLVAMTGAALLVRWRVRRPRGAGTGHVDLAGVAFLAGGPRRVVEMSIAKLLESGGLRPSRGGQVAAVTGTAPHPIDASVLAETGPLPRQVDTVIRRVSGGPAVTAVGDLLVSQRLLVPPATARAVQRRAVVGLYLLLAVGVVRLVTGIVGDYPVDSLGVLLLLTAAITAVLRTRRVPARTVPGDEALAAARDTGWDQPHTSPSRAVAIAGGAGLVALGGLAAFPDAAIREALVVSATDGARSWAYTSSSGGGGCGSYSSCGSSGDGGGSGGSSCGGGCGGGGGD